MYLYNTSINSIFQKASPLEQKIFWKQKLKRSETSSCSSETCLWSVRVMSALSKYPVAITLIDNSLGHQHEAAANDCIGRPEWAVLHGRRWLWASVGTAIETPVPPFVTCLHLGLWKLSFMPLHVGILHFHSILLNFPGLPQGWKMIILGKSITKNWYFLI